MKAFTETFRKSFVVMTMLGLLAACGKDNKVNSDQVAVNNGSPTGTSVPLSSQQSTQINQIKTQYPCSGGQRLPDMAYNTSGIGNLSGNTTRVEGQFNPGTIGGTVAAVYVGVSNFGDVMVVSKMTTGGSQIVGYNVVISMCTMEPLVSPNRQLSGFQAPYGIILDDDTNCGLGSVDLASLTILQAAAYQMYPPAVVETTFTKPMNCGGTQQSGGYYNPYYPYY